jgi:hypothetical protein
MVPLTAVVQTTWEPLHGQNVDTITSNSSSGRRTQKTARTGRSELERLRCHSVAPDGSFIDDDLVGRAGLMLAASSGTVTLSPSGLFALLLFTPAKSPRRMTDGACNSAASPIFFFHNSDKQISVRRDSTPLRLASCRGNTRPGVVRKCDTTARAIAACSHPIPW